MEKITLDHDIKVLYVSASSFPDGVMEAHKKIHELAPASGGRKYYGLSRPENGQIKYMAAAEELSVGEADKLHCDTMIIKSGLYVSHTIKDFMQNVPAIGKTFQELLAQPNIDHNGYCVEYYFNDNDVQCMVRLASESA